MSRAGCAPPRRGPRDRMAVPVSRIVAEAANRLSDPGDGSPRPLAAHAGKVLAIRAGAGFRAAFRILGDGRLEPVHGAIDADCEAELAGLGEDGRPTWKVAGESGLLEALSGWKGPGASSGAAALATLAAPVLARAGAEAVDVRRRLRDAAGRYGNLESGRVVTRDRLAGRRREIARFAGRVREAAALLERALKESGGKPGER